MSPASGTNGRDSPPPGRGNVVRVCRFGLKSLGLHTSLRKFGPPFDSAPFHALDSPNPTANEKANCPPRPPQSVAVGRYSGQIFWNMFYDFTKEELDEIQEVLFQTAMQSGAMMPPAPCLIKAHQRYRESCETLTNRPNGQRS